MLFKVNVNTYFLAKYNNLVPDLCRMNGNMGQQYGADVKKATQKTV